MKTFYLILLGLLWTSFEATATHNRAGEILVKQLDDLTVEVFIITYTKLSSVAADRDTLTINWGDGNLEAIPRTNGNGEPISNNTKKNIYSQTHTYATTSTYTLSMTDPNRNQGILNVNPPLSDNVPFHIETVFVMVDMDPGEVNQTPVLLQSPIDIGFVNEPFVHVPNAFDLDGDSLAYELITPMSALNTNVPNYTMPNELGQGNSTLTINPETGMVIWDSPEMEGEYAIAILIKSYRNGIEVDRMVRDMQIIIKEGMGFAPDISFFGAQANDIIPVNLGDTAKITFTIVTLDTINPLQVNSTCGLYDYYNNPATFDVEVNGNIGTATFEWVVMEEHLRKHSYQLVIQAVGGPPENGYSTFAVFRFNTVDFVSSNDPRPELSATIKLYPNPVSEQLFLDTDIKFPLDYTIVNSVGQICKNGVVRNAGNAIGIHQLAKGWYNLQVTSVDEKQVRVPFVIR